MSDIAPPVAALIEEFSKLPGVGVKTAQRLTFFILRSPTDQARRLAEAIMRVKESIVYCSRCFNITETDPCAICSNPNRDQEMICVVEEPLDVLALEKTGVYKGLYHVLHGALSPCKPESARHIPSTPWVPVRHLAAWARSLTESGTANTANYIQKELKPFNVHITGLARGLPIGGDLEYADEGTLSRAIEGRREM